MKFFMPTRFISGRGCVRANGGLIAGLGRHCLIVTGRSSAEKCGALADLCSVLDEAGIEYAVYNSVTANPSVELCLKGGEAARAFGADFIAGIGGGSALDAAKVIALAAANPGMDEAGLYSAVWENMPLPKLLIGTTAGTGSEVTSVAVLTDSARRKHSIHDVRLYADLSLGDPAYTDNLSPDISYSTGIDAFAHCVESFFSRKADSASEASAAAGIRLLMPLLAKLKNGENISPAERDTLYEASILGGFAINMTGTVFPHTLGYYLTENYHLPHGVASAAFLPGLITHIAETEPDRTEYLCSLIGTEPEEFTALVNDVCPLPAFRLSEEEIEAALPRWDSNGSVKNTRGPVSRETLRRAMKRLS